ncbi:hypothetical protein QE152_g35134 [Popillia japonica]|uniref:Uncharacterized protein n=1 Tax=Popillia japonica TaxID=7064 RepID=A0AAW1IS94_POPJA
MDVSTKDKTKFGALSIILCVCAALKVKMKNRKQRKYKNGEEDAGLLALIAVVSGGCVGSLLFGFILDKTHKFKLTTFTILFLSSIFFILTAISLEKQHRIFTFITGGVFGFFLAGSLVVGFEYSAEVAYPEPEAKQQHWRF